MLRRKISKRKKRKKKKVLNSTGGKMRCNIFLKKVWAFFAFHAHSFFQKTLYGLDIVSAFFPDVYLYFLFFYFFLLLVLLILDLRIESFDCKTAFDFGDLFEVATVLSSFLENSFSLDISKFS